MNTTSTTTMMFEWEEPEPTLDQLIECVKRELAYRRNVYPRRIFAGRMTEQKADQQLRLMEAVLANLERQRN
jgi:hypothetical protein